jgi:hypothetical protein
MRTIIADTGPMVAVINRRDQFHIWAVDSLKIIKEPLHTCEAVLTEALFDLGTYREDQSDCWTF